MGCESGVSGEDFWAHKCPLLRPENSKDKVLPFLGFFRSSIFVRARFCGGFWATNSVICIGCFFAGSGWAFLYGFSRLIQGVLVFLPFSGLWGRGFRFFCSSLPPSSSPFLLSESAWVLLLFFSACAARTANAWFGRCGACLHGLFLFLFCSLCPAGPSLLSLPCSSLSLSLSLSLFLRFLACTV